MLLIADESANLASFDSAVSIPLRYCDGLVGRASCSCVLPQKMHGLEVQATKSQRRIDRSLTGWIKDVAREDSFQSELCAEQLKALSEPMRLRIVEALQYGEMTVSDIALAVDNEVVLVSHHLGILKNAQIVERKRDGRYMIYRLRPDLLQKVRGSNKAFLNLGCCRLEVPQCNAPTDS